MKERLIWADLVRVLGVYLIIVLHVTGPTTFNNQLSIFTSIIVNTCVPLLVLLSGALLLSKSESYTIFFRKRVSKVLVPWIFWSSLFTILVIFFTHANPSSSFHIFHGIFIPLFWFMAMIFGIYCLTPALRIFLKSAQEKDIWLILFFWFISVSLLPFFRSTEAFPASTDNGLVRLVILFLGYYILGFQMVKFKKNKTSRNILILLFVLTLIIILFTQLLNINKSYPGFSSPIIVLTSSLLFGIIYYFKDILQTLNPKIRKTIEIFSKATLGIFFLHFLFINRLPVPSILKGGYLVKYYSGIEEFINGALIFLICFLIIFAVSKIPKLKTVIGYS